MLDFIKSIYTYADEEEEKSEKEEETEEEEEPEDPRPSIEEGNFKQI